MTTRNILLTLAVIVCIGLMVVGFKHNASPDDTTAPNHPTGKMSMILYESQAYKFSFEYPSGYYTKESAGGELSPDALMHITLVDDTDKNRDFLAHKPQTEPQTVPMAISVEVYANEQELDTSRWIEQTGVSMNNDMGNVMVGDMKGELFSRDALFHETRVIVSKHGFIYVFAVQSENSDDQILKDFNMILNSTRFTD